MIIVFDNHFGQLALEFCLNEKEEEEKGKWNYNI